MDVPLMSTGLFAVLVLAGVQHAEQIKEFSAAGIWSPLLEDLVVKKLNRDDKVMKFKSEHQKIVTPSDSSEKEVTETDLYLLAAIEKLVHRVDVLEKRLSRTEELLYTVIANSKPNEISGTHEPCPANFSHIASSCYYVSENQLNWKSSASMCRAMGASLAELDSIGEKLDIIAYLQVSKVKDVDFWTGGLYPGLLWIWANSARPIATNSSSTTVYGNGRCLMLFYNPAIRNYEYRGEDCGLNAKYICEFEPNSASYALEHI